MRTVGKPNLQPRSIAVVVVLCVFALAVFVPPAGATGTLDQQQTQVGASEFVLGPDEGPQSLAQTFTAGITGALDQVDLHLARTTDTVEPLTVEIRNVSAGAPGSIVLATATVPAANVPTDALTFVAVPFAVPAPVVTGTQFAIVAYTGGSGVYLWGHSGSPDDPYEQGAPFVSGESPPITWTGPFNLDFAFKTYVTTLAPPPADDKVVICHKPGAKNEKTKEVPASAVPEHLAHGDTLGAC